MKIPTLLGVLAIASLLSPASAGAQSRPRPTAPVKTKPKTPVKTPVKAEPAPPKAAVADPGSVQVTGEVILPGKIPLGSASLAVIEALTLQGGLTTNAGEEVFISRRPKAGAEPELITINRLDLEQGNAAANRVLQDGDVLNVPTIQRYAITGNVKRPGSYPLRRGTTVEKAIAMAGGLTENGSDKGIKINRAPNLQSLRAVTVDVNLSDAVQPNDEIKIKDR